MENALFLDTLVSNYYSCYSEYPDIEQKQAWKSSLDYLRNVLKDTTLKDLHIVLEYRLPFSGERIDAILLGEGVNKKPLALVIELKGWKKAVSLSDIFVDTDAGKQIHPEYQLKNYIGKIKFSHSASDKFEIRGVVLMYNITRSSCDIVFSGHHFFKGEEKDFRNFLEEIFSSPIDETVANEFINGKYVQNKRLFDAVRDHFDEITNASHLALAENGFGLSSEQLQLVSEILEDLKNGKEVVYLVQGAPGSGKTLLAVHLLLSSLSQGYSTVLGYRNNRLINTIRDVFNSIKAGLSSPIKFYSTGRPKNPGIAEKGFKGFFDLVIYDEAQRMTKENIYYGLQRGKVTVFFYDESQILNAEEEGTTDNFKDIASKLEKPVKERRLKGFYRVQGGREYHEWVETLLTNPDNVDTNPSWRDSYEFKVFPKIEDMLDELRSKLKDSSVKVGLIAAFTESPGDIKNPKSIRNLRIGYPLYSGFGLYKHFPGKIYWLMDPRRDYVPFWVKGECNRLEKCASIYGCQGFEIDYAGIIWGRDLVYRDGKWEIGSNCEDNIGRPSLKQIIQKAKNGDKQCRDLAIKLLVNRYRIFLTRGMKGTYVFCEDKETLNFLRSLI